MSAPLFSAFLYRMAEPVMIGQSAGSSYYSPMATVYLGMGSNLGDRAAHLARAAELLRTAEGVTDVRMSNAYETEPVGPIEQGRYLNAAAAIETTLEPAELLALLHTIEADAGRDAPADRQRWGPRELDLDILLYADQVIDEPGLSVPHPRMHERWFVLRPLAEVGPEATHPVLGKTVRELLAEVEAKEARVGG